jgi:hypothetical protein
MKIRKKRKIKWRKNRMKKTTKQLRKRTMEVGQV